MMLDFDHSFFGYPQQSGYGLKVDAGLVRSTFGSGDTRQRRKRRSFPMEIPVQFKFNTAQLNAFMTFLDMYGYDWFQMKLAVPGATDDIVRWKEVRFSGNPSTSYPAHDTHIVSINMESRDASNTADYLAAMTYVEPYYCEPYYTVTG